MNIGFLASFITFSLLVYYNVKKRAKRSRKQEAEFWARESAANSVRRKSLDGLPYIKIPLENFPTHLLQDNSEVLECIETMEFLSDKKNPQSHRLVQHGLKAGVRHRQYHGSVRI